VSTIGISVRLGFSSITFTDHEVVPQWEPLAALAAVAAVTDTIAVGTLVLDTGLRNPVLTAKASATLELLSEGPLELGLSAGCIADNFAAVGVPSEGAADRIARLEEGLSLMRRLWTEPSTTVGGRYFEVKDASMVEASRLRRWCSSVVEGARSCTWAGAWRTSCP
jgi:alkanesulfonate monooxygenase SsuD/methylene tetrahydromethanopterin reductase-like flavin-dependent oxidoreductase (luciferase family)